MRLNKSEEDRINYFQNKEIIIRVGKKYNLTETEALLLYAQYWHEYVLKSITDLEHPVVVVENLCRFEAQPHSIKIEANKQKKAGVIEHIHNKLIKLYETTFKYKNKQDAEFAPEKAKKYKRILVKDVVLLWVTNREPDERGKRLSKASLKSNQGPNFDKGLS